MCTSRRKQVACLSWFITYQLALIYGWIIFILSADFDIETMYCPPRLTGKILEVYPYNITDE